MAGYVCFICGHNVHEARVWDGRTICRTCTYRPLGKCWLCGDEITGVVTPLRFGRVHFSVEHTCNVAAGGGAA